MPVVVIIVSIYYEEAVPHCFHSNTDHKLQSQDDNYSKYICLITTLLTCRLSCASVCFSSCTACSISEQETACASFYRLTFLVSEGQKSTGQFSGENVQMCIINS